MTEKDKEAISAAFDDMAMYGRGFTRMTADGITHVPYHEAMNRTAISSRVESEAIVEAGQKYIRKIADELWGRK